MIVQGAVCLAFMVLWILCGPRQALQLDLWAELMKPLFMFWALLCVVAAVFGVWNPNLRVNVPLFGLMCFGGTWWACVKVLGSGELYEGMPSPSIVYCGLSLIPVVPTLIYVVVVNSLARKACQSRALNRNEPDARLSVMPLVAGTICILALLLVGLSAPVFTKIYHECGIDPLPLRLKVVSMIHWWWTLPAGVAVALVLARGRQRWCVRTNRIVGAITILLSFAVLVAYALSACTVMYFTMSE
jgi:hypothetical protein